MRGELGRSFPRSGEGQRWPGRPCRRPSLPRAASSFAGGTGRAGPTDAPLRTAWPGRVGRLRFWPSAQGREEGTVLVSEHGSNSEQLVHAGGGGGGAGQSWRKHLPKAGRRGPAPAGCALDSSLSRSASEPSDLPKALVCLLIYLGLYSGALRVLCGWAEPAPPGSSVETWGLGPSPDRPNRRGARVPPVGARTNEPPTDFGAR